MRVSFINGAMFEFIQKALGKIQSNEKKCIQQNISNLKMRNSEAAHVPITHKDMGKIPRAKYHGLIIIKFDEALGLTFLVIHENSFKVAKMTVASRQQAKAQVGSGIDSNESSQRSKNDGLGWRGELKCPSLLSK